MTYVLIAFSLTGCANEVQQIALPSAELIRTEDNVNGGLYFSIYENDLRRDSICEVAFTIEGVFEEECGDCLVQNLELDLYSEAACGTRIELLNAMKWRVELNENNSLLGSWVLTNLMDM